MAVWTKHQNLGGGDLQFTNWSADIFSCNPVYRCLSRFEFQYYQPSTWLIDFQVCEPLPLQLNISLKEVSVRPIIVELVDGEPDSEE